MPAVRLDAYWPVWKSRLMSSAADATPSAGSGARHSFENVSCAKEARHLAQRARRAPYARLVRRLTVPLRFVQWSLLAAAWGRLEIDCQPAVYELFAGCARERPSLDLLRRERDGHLNYSTETLTAVLALQTRLLSCREHILNKVEGAAEKRTLCARPVCFVLAFPPGSWDVVPSRACL